MNRQEQEQLKARVGAVEEELRSLRALLEDILGKLKPPTVYSKRDVSRRARI